MRTIIILLVALAGCEGKDDADSGTTTTDDTTATAATGTGTGASTGTGTGSVTTPKTYAADYDGVVAFMMDSCISCHRVAGPANDLPFPDHLERDLFFDAGELVVPGDPQASLLWRVVSGQVEGDEEVMPRGSGPLPAETTAHIEAWILAGAPATLPVRDYDGDGFASDVDCDEANGAVNPGADEVCGDGLDNDCSGDPDGPDAVDATTWYPDRDGDTFGDDDFPVVACEAPEDHVATPGDCDDTSTAFNPNAAESDCEDPNDYNCDGSTGYADVDGDGLPACAECDDNDATVGLGEDFYQDLDGDGYGTTADVVTACTVPQGYADNPDDCNDDSPYAYPGNPEVCDGLDNDCNTYTDDDAADAQTWWPDGDGDGYGDPDGTSVTSCEAPPYHADNPRDCDDTNYAFNPGADELAGTGEDEDCDGYTDEPSLSHAIDIQPIWDQACGPYCHVVDYAYEGLRLDGDAYPNLVGVPSQELPTMNRIEPNSLDDSYLWHKINDTHLTVGGSGNSMPYDEDLLPQSARDRIAAWIIGGARP